MWEVLLSFTSKISSDLKNHSLAPALLMTRKTGGVRSLPRYRQENSSSAPSLPCMRSLNQDDKANSDRLGLVPGLIPGLPQPLPPPPQNGRPRCGQQTDLDSVLGIWEMDTSWEASSVVEKRRSWIDLGGTGNRDIGTTGHLHSFPGFSVLSFILI